MKVNIDIDGKSVEIEFNKALQLTRQKALRRPQEAVSLALNIIAQQPEQPAIYHVIYPLLIQRAQYQRLEEISKNAIKHIPDDGQSYYALSTAQRFTRKPNQSLHSLIVASDLSPEQYRWKLQLAIQYKEFGGFEQAISLLDQCTSQGPLLAEALYWRFGLTKRLSEQEIASLEAIISNRHKGIQSTVIYAAFCLYQYFEHVEDYQGAWRCLVIANSMKHEQLTQRHSYTIAHELREHHDVLTHFSQELLNETNTNTKRQLAKPSTVEQTEQANLFICGLPRSGTTLAEQILSSHTKVTAGDELFALAQASAKVLKESAIAEPFPMWTKQLTANNWHDIGLHYHALTEELRNSEDKVNWLTDKMPLNYKAIGLIHMALPNAKIIYCRRDPVDILFGCYKQLLGDGNHYCYDLDELCDMIIAHYRVMSHWLTLLPDKIYTLDYAKLIKNQQQVTRELLDFVDLEWQQACIDFHLNERVVHTVSNVQIRQPLSNTSVRAWEPYKAELQPYIDKLAAASIES